MIHETFKNKYLKYKNKYLKLKGGASFSSSASICGINSQKNLHIYFHEEFSEHASSQTKAINRHITELFKEPYWDIINPRGNGLCMIYSIFYGLEIIPPLGETFETFINKSIIDGLKKYFKLNPTDDGYMFDKSDGAIIYITKDILDNEKLLNEMINDLLNDDNISSRVLPILSLGLNISILVLSCDRKSADPFLQQYCRNTIGRLRAEPRTETKGFDFFRPIAL